MSTPDADERIATLATLSDATRRSLYDYVWKQEHAVSRDDVASKTGVSRSLAAYHLDRLVDAGLLTARFARPAGRSGPGAGRPTKLYERSDEVVEVSLPHRNYALAARVFVEALAADRSPAALDTLTRASRAIGREIGQSLGACDTESCLLEQLAAMGYEPYVDSDRTVRLRNCLFNDLTREQRELTCSMNLGLVEGALATSDEPAFTARLDPGDGRCCVAIDHS